MKVKVSNYIAQKLTENGINQVFTVTGGGAMHLMMLWDISRGFIAFISTTSRPAPWRLRLMPEFTIKLRLCV